MTGRAKSPALVAFVALLALVLAPRGALAQQPGYAKPTQGPDAGCTTSGVAGARCCYSTNVFYIWPGPPPSTSLGQQCQDGLCGLCAVAHLFALADSSNSAGGGPGGGCGGARLTLRTARPESN